ncbi:MAG TPA: cytochrome d ubiquinol oxidase subunit II, partial [Desulfobaccales bacterium]|nr:cytochrome d ubiquinol oxidase subunit II [Desulfobaccales bacterium]
MALELILPNVWFAIIGFVLFLAVALDGFDLGIGILSLFTKDEHRRGILMASIGPFWHANLTWLVITGGLFFGAFPLAYGVVFSALYIPAIAMLIAFAFRGVAFDFRQEARDKKPWNLSFGLGSLIAILAQGFGVGGYLSGLAIQGNQFVGGIWDWLNPFAAVVAVALVFGYVLLGATWLIMKTEGDVQLDSYRYAQVGAWILLCLAVSLIAWSGFRYPFLPRKWFTFPEFWLTFFPFLLAVPVFILLIWSLIRRQETAPFLLSLVVVGLATFATAAGIHPYVIPPSVTLATAASPQLTLAAMLIVVG